MRATLAIATDGEIWYSDSIDTDDTLCSGPDPFYALLDVLEGPDKERLAKILAEFEAADEADIARRRAPKEV